MLRIALPAALAAAGLLAALSCAHAAPSRSPILLSPSHSAAVGDPAHPEGLAQAVQAAYDKGARQIVIRRGVYVMPDVGHTSLALKGWKDAALSGAGVTLILTDLAWMHDGIDLIGCTHVTLAGFLLSQNKVTFYQGRVVAVGSEAGKPYCDWRPDTGYPVPPADETVAKGFLGGNVNVVDAHTRLLKAGVGDHYNVKAEAQADGTFRARMGGGFGVGDWLVGRHGPAPFKVYLSNSRDCTVKNITLMRSGFAPLREDGGGGNHYLHCVWALGPRPAGATEYPLVTNAADGMHMIGSFPGPDIENCVFQGVFLDDCIAIHGSLQTVQSVSGSTLTLKGRAGQVRAGEPVRISDSQGFFAEAMVASVKDNGSDTTLVTLDKDYGVPPSAKLSNPRADGMGYKIIGCRLGCTRSRGILAKADHGLIKNNILENCGMSAVSLGPEYYWDEADYVQNITVEDNIIRKNGGAGYGGAAILVHGDGAIGNRNIIIRGNRMASNDQGDMDLQWVDGVTLTGNTLTAPARMPDGINPHSPLALANCRNIALRGNVVQNAAGYKSELVAVGPDVTGLAHNDPSGIRAALPPAPLPPVK